MLPRYRFSNQPTYSEIDHVHERLLHFLHFDLELVIHGLENFRVTIFRGHVTGANEFVIRSPITDYLLLHARMSRERMMNSSFVVPVRTISCFMRALTRGIISWMPLAVSFTFSTRREWYLVYIEFVQFNKARNLYATIIVK